MRLSRASGYAIRAVVYLASQTPGRRCEAQEIAEHQDIPIQFLWKILQMLCRRGLLQSVRGTGGGYRLAVPPETLHLAEIIDAVGDTSGTEECLLRFQNCTAENPCVLHHRWASLRQQSFEMLEKTTVAELAVRSLERKEREPA